MKIKNNRSSSILLILTVIVLFLTLLYYTYLSYNKYKEQSYVVNNIMLTDKITTALNYIDKERTLSAIYMGTNQKEDLSKLEKYRLLVDSELEEISTIVSKNKKISIHQSIIKNIFTDLIYTRSRVNILSLNYQHILFENYSNKVSKPLMDIVNTLLNTSSIPDNYFKLLIVKENLYAEKSFISFILSGHKAMNYQDLLRWEHLLEKDTLSTKLGKLTYLRGEIFLNSSTGFYGTTLKKWIEVNAKKNEIIEKMEQTVLVKVKKSIEIKLSLLKRNIIKYGVVSLLLFIIFIILFLLYKKSLNDSRLLIDTLSDLESDLDENQREEIKRVLNQNDTLAIYRFLINAIKEPSRAKDHFLANMSHEIRTPLNGIIGFTNILKETDLKEDQQEFLAIIEESSNNLISIVNDILDFSKVASGKVEIENVSFDVMKKFEASIDSYAAKAAQKNIDLNLLIDPNLPTELMGDVTKISQVIINLLSNSVKFTDEGGRVDIEIKQVLEQNNKVTLKFSITDSGIGMSPEEQEKVFDSFSQADASTSRKFGGTGLGLTISKKFVALMGGDLELTSKEGEGTTFFFSLDLEKSPNATTREVTDFSHLNISYVTVPNRDWVTENLQTYIGYNGSSLNAVNYKDILSLKSSELPDILFVDHQYIADEKIIASLCEVDTKVILISTAEIEKCDCEMKNRVAKILYKPVNFSKTVRSLNIVKKETLSVKDTVSIELSEIDNIGSTRVFKNISALIVEDNIINQKLLKRILNNFDITVTLANNGLEALNFRKKYSYDIIFMDIQMPVMDGVESTQKIIEYEEFNEESHVPIIALTANTLAYDKDKYLEAGMDKYLKKPIDVSELTTIIEEYFPIKEIRDIMPIHEHIDTKQSSIPAVILYKETELTAKIYSAVLNNLGYSVDMYSSTDKFLKNLEAQSYKFALFDAKPFRAINSENFLVDLIIDSGATPIAFVEKKSENDYCETLDSIGRANEISEKLYRCG